jgi:hypothetical protein
MLWDTGVEALRSIVSAATLMYFGLLHDAISEPATHVGSVVAGHEPTLQE